MKLRTLSLLLVIAVSLGFAAGAEAARPEIKSDTKYFDLARGVYVLKGNVSVAVNNRLITAGEARVSVMSLEVWGTDGITLTQDGLSFSGDNVYVNGRRHNATMKGGVTFRRGGLSITADEADYNWQTKQGEFRSNVRVDDNGAVIEAGRLAYDIATNTYLAE